MKMKIDSPKKINTKFILQILIYFVQTCEKIYITVIISLAYIIFIYTIFGGQLCAFTYLERAYLYSNG